VRTDGRLVAPAGRGAIAMIDPHDVAASLLCSSLMKARGANARADGSSGRVEVARAGPGFAELGRVGLRRHRVAEVLQRVEDAHAQCFAPSSFPVMMQPPTRP
jgi:hypothetical protein